MRLWEWVSIKYGDNRSDEQRDQDAKLLERQKKALAKFQRHKAKLKPKATVTNLDEQRRKK